MWFRRLVLILLLPGAISQSWGVEKKGDRLVIFAFENQAGHVQFDNFHHYLHLKLLDASDFKKFSFEVWEIPFQGTESFEKLSASGGTAALFGRFFNDSLSGQPRLSFSFVQSDSNHPVDKTFSVAGLSLEEITKVVELKLSSYWESQFGRLLVNSIPPGCQVFLNGVDQGTTPKELFLKEGQYAIEII